MEVIGIKLSAQEISEVKRRYILYYAPYYKSVSVLAKVLGFSRMLVYRHMHLPQDLRSLEETIGTRRKDKDHPELLSLEAYAETLMHDGQIEVREAEIIKIRNKYSKNRQTETIEKKISKKSVTGNAAKKGVTVSKKKKTGSDKIVTASRPIKQERVDIALWVMEQYSQGLTIRDACLQAGTNSKTFYNWIDEEHDEYSAVIAKIYIEAKKKLRRMLQDELLTHAQNSLINMIQDRELVRTTRYGAVDATGQTVVKSVIQTSYTREASLTAVMRVLMGLGKAIGQTYDDAETKHGEYSLMQEDELDKYMADEEQRIQDLIKEQQKLLNEPTTGKDIEAGKA